MIQEMEAPSRTQIAGIVDALAETWNRHDMAAYAALFAEDADFVNVIGMHWRGRREIEAVHNKLHETVFRDTALRGLEWIVKFPCPDVAVGHISWEMTGARGTENWKVPEVRHGKITMVLVPAETAEYGWLITDLQNTEVVPMSMAELDGK